MHSHHRHLATTDIRKYRHMWKATQQEDHLKSVLAWVSPGIPLEGCPKHLLRESRRKNQKKSGMGASRYQCFIQLTARNREIEDDQDDEFDDYFDYIWRLWRQWICALLHSLDFTLIQTFISEPNFPPTPVKAVRHIRTTSTIPGGKPNWRFYACNMYWWYYIMYYHNKYYYYVFLLNHDKFV